MRAARNPKRASTPPKDETIMGHYPQGDFAVKWNQNLDSWILVRDGSLVHEPPRWSKLPEMGSPILKLPTTQEYDRQRDERRQALFDKGKDAKAALDDIEEHSPTWVKIIRDYIALLEANVR